jgi:hypothetical protein
MLVRRICEEMATDANPLFPLGKLAELSCDLAEPTAAISHDIMMNLALAPSAKASFARWYKPMLEPCHPKLRGVALCLHAGRHCQWSFAWKVDTIDTLDGNGLAHGQVRTKLARWEFKVVDVCRCIGQTFRANNG